MFTMRSDIRAPSTGAPVSELYAAALEMTSWAESRGAVAAIACEHHGQADGYLPPPWPPGRRRSRSCWPSSSPSTSRCAWQRRWWSWTSSATDGSATSAPSATARTSTTCSGWTSVGAVVSPTSGCPSSSGPRRASRSTTTDGPSGSPRCRCRTADPRCRGAGGATQLPVGPVGTASGPPPSPMTSRSGEPSRTQLAEQGTDRARAISRPGTFPPACSSPMTWIAHGRSSAPS